MKKARTTRGTRAKKASTPKDLTAKRARAVKGGATASVHGGWDTLANKKF